MNSQDPPASVSSGLKLKTRGVGARNPTLVPGLEQQDFAH